MDGITELAGKKLKSVLDAAQLSPEKCYRYRIRNGEGELKVDARGPADVVYEYGGRTVLVMDKKTAKILGERKLDFKDNGFCLV
jgi:hypothetical protein